MSDNTTTADAPPDFAGQAQEAHRAIAAIHEQAQQQISEVTLDHQEETEDEEG